MPSNSNYDYDSESNHSVEDSSELNQLHELIESDPDLNAYTFHEEFLTMFLRCRGSAKKALKRLKAYVKKMKQRPEIFQWNDDLGKAVESDIIQLCTEKNADGGGILVIRPGNFNAKVASPQEIFQMAVLGTAFDEEIQRNGIHLLIDASGGNLFQLWSFGRSNIQYLGELVETALPVKVQKIHVAFEHPLATFVYNLFRPFTSKKIRQRVVFHGDDMKSLYECCPSSSIPSKFGGTNDEKYTFDDYKKVLDHSQSILMSVWSQFQKKKSKK